MSLGILNNIAALYAENNLNSTQASLQTTLQQLSSGSRINSGADDPAGLAVSDGLGANEAALTQSSQNATDGIGLLQTADGALSQVTSLLDQAVTLATESANGTLTSGQVSSANQEYQNILSQIGNIGSTTNFNSSNVFSATATNIVVTDGTSNGLNTYADTIGALSTASVGTTASAAITTSSLTPTTSAPVSAVAGAAGSYTITANSANDTLAGTLSLSLGEGTPLSINVASGTATQVAAALNGNGSNTAFSTAGYTASASGAVLTITAPSGSHVGATAASNTISFTGTNLSDTGATTAVVGAVGTAAATGTSSTGTLTVSGAASNDSDTYGGTIVLTQGGQTQTITLNANSTFSTDGSNTQAGSIQAQIVTALAGTGFTLAAGTGTDANPVLNFTGANNATAITVDTSGLTTSGSATFADGGTAGTAPTQGTYTLTGLTSGTDTFATGTQIVVNGTTVSLGGDNAAQAATAIGSDGGSAATSSGGVVTINGSASGAALSVTAVGGGAVTGLTDQAVANAALTTGTQATAPAGVVAAGGKTVITLGSANDTIAGNLNIVVGTSGAANKTVALTVAANTTGQALATQINNSSAFQAAGLSASYDSSTFAVTISAATGSTNTPAVNGLVTTGTALTDSTASAPGAGANFTSASVSQLTAANAANILTTVTSAVADVAYQRGTIGADVNELTSASNVASAEEVNLTSAQDTIQATDYGAAASNLSKYQILSQTGISALAQANSVQQEVLKLLQ